MIKKCIIRNNQEAKIPSQVSFKLQILGVDMKCPFLLIKPEDV